MHGATASRHQPVCEIPGLLSRLSFKLINYFFFFLTQVYVLYNLENENELLASMDIDHPVRNSTNNT